MAGDLTRDQLVTEICDIVGKNTAATSVSGAALQTRVRTYLNWAQRRIARYFSFHELNAVVTTAVTVADTKTYTFSTLGISTAKDIHSIRLIISSTAESRKLKRWTAKRSDERIPDPTLYSSGIPSIYVRYIDQIELFRIPDAAYNMTIRYPKWPTAFTTGSQTSDYSNKDEILVTAGVMETYLALEEYTDAALWYKRVLGMLKDAQLAEGDDVDLEVEGEPFSSDSNLQTGQPWLSPSGTPGDPLYGYID